MTFRADADAELRCSTVEFESGISAPYRSGPKRLIDLTSSVLGVILLAPFLLLVGLLVKLDSRGPMLYCQRRTGYAGSTFLIYKFRTMKVAEEDDEVVHATKGDGRTTRLGRFLRRSSLDELPQLFNVLKGEMSLVGPRPHAVKHDRIYSQTIATYGHRFLVRPGITGLAQVRGLRGEIEYPDEMAERVALDLRYIENWSIWLDIKILVQTLILVPFHNKAY
jgi:putative colanic acid biosynthesis UDP-glucose lipid carrier transferase